MIEDALKTAENPVVLFSGGIDSLLVLYKVRQFKEVDVITFNQNFTKEQWTTVDRVIQEWGLEVTTYPPKNSYLIPNMARVDEYDLAGMDFPVVRDFIDADRCSLELDNKKLASFPWRWDVVFTGSKKSDESFATGKSPFKEAVVKFGDITFMQPLFFMSDVEVRAEAERLNLPFSKEFYADGDERFNSGNLVACTNCLQGKGKVWCPADKKYIDSVTWDKDGMLLGFRQKYGFDKELTYVS